MGAPKRTLTSSSFFRQRTGRRAPGDFPADWPGEGSAEAVRPDRRARSGGGPDHRIAADRLRPSEMRTGWVFVSLSKRMEVDGMAWPPRE